MTGGNGGAERTAELLRARAAGRQSAKIFSELCAWDRVMWGSLCHGGRFARSGKSSRNSAGVTEGSRLRSRRTPGMAEETRTTDREPRLLDLLVGPDDADRANRLTTWLSDEYRNRLRLFATRRLRDVVTAEDVVQETLPDRSSGTARRPRSRAGGARGLCVRNGSQSLYAPRPLSWTRSEGLERLATTPPPVRPTCSRPSSAKSGVRRCVRRSIA